MTRNELKKIIEADAVYYNSFSKTAHIKMALTQSHFYVIHRYMKLLRYEEFYRHKSAEKCCFSGWNKFMELIYARKKNKIGNKLGVYVPPNTIGAGTVIFHHGTIIINGEARLGNNCRLHGNNCIGNNGITFDAPKLGDNVDIGFGAAIIGNVTIADEVKIGAGAVVVSSFLDKGITIGGVPARRIK